VGIKEQITLLLQQEKYKEAGDIISDQLEKERIKPEPYFANIVLLGANWGHINRFIHPSINCLLTTGWLNSLRSLKPVNANNEPIPWFTYPAISFLDTIINSNWSVFEWGSGHSTIWWSKRIKKITSVESNSTWYNIIKNEIEQNVTLQLHNEKDKYIKSIHENSQLYDAIIIDGRHRNECAEEAIKHVKEEGIIIFDNSDRLKYNNSILSLQDQGFYRLDFWGLIPGYMHRNCTSFFMKEHSIFQNNKPPSQLESSIGLSCAQALKK